MRVKLFILFLGICQLSFSQDYKPLEEASIEPNRIGTVLDFPNLDSLQFEFRYFHWGFGVGQSFLQIALDKDNKWNYRIGYITSDSLKVRITEENNNKIDWQLLWSRLDSIKLESIPSQLDLKLIYTMDNGEQGEVNTQRYFDVVMDGSYSYMEWFRPTGYLSIGYDNPDEYEQILANHKLTGVQEHKRFNQAIFIFIECFNLRSNWQQQVEERYHLSDKRKKKRKKKNNGM